MVFEIRIRKIIVRIVSIIIRLTQQIPTLRRIYGFSELLNSFRNKINLNLFYDYKFLAYVHNKKKEIDSNAKFIKTLVIGSSHADYGFYPDLVKYSFNLGLTSGDLFLSYHIYKAIKLNLIKLENVVLFYSVFSPGFSLIKTKERYRSVAYNYFFDIPYQDQKQINNRYEKKIFERCEILETTTIKDHFYTYSTQKEYDLFQSASERAAIHLRENIRCPDQMKWLSVLINDIFDDKKKLFILLPPVREDYKKALPNSDHLFLKLKKLISQKNNVTLLNFFDSNKFNYDDFGDADHLNERGAIKLTGELSKYLNN